jgi:hypothetical protein
MQSVQIFLFGVNGEYGYGCVNQPLFRLLRALANFCK